METYLASAGLLPWLVALPLGALEFWNVARRYSYRLAPLAAIVAFAASFAWAAVVVHAFHDMPIARFSAVQATALLIGPPMITLLAARKSTIAIGTLAGLIGIVCIIWFSFVIGGMLYGGE